MGLRQEHVGGQIMLAGREGRGANSSINSKRESALLATRTVVCRMNGWQASKVSGAPCRHIGSAQDKCRVIGSSGRGGRGEGRSMLHLPCMAGSCKEIIAESEGFNEKIHTSYLACQFETSSK